MSNPMQELLRRFSNLSKEDFREHHHATPQRVLESLRDKYDTADYQIETLGCHNPTTLAEDEWGPIEANFDKKTYKELRRNPEYANEIVEGLYSYKDELDEIYTTALIATLKRAYDDHDVLAFESVLKVIRNPPNIVSAPILESETEEGIRLREAVAYVGEILGIPIEAEPIDFRTMINDDAQMHLATA